MPLTMAAVECALHYAGKAWLKDQSKIVNLNVYSQNSAGFDGWY